MVDPILIHPDSVWHGAKVRHALGVSSESLRAAEKSGMLRYARIGNRTLYRGSWLLDWLQSASARAGRVSTHFDCPPSPRSLP